MEKIQQKHTYPFLQGGGEMGELTRNFDWSTTSVGSPDEWPQSLRTTVSNLLRSKFPMFLWWGEDMIQFYNDAYRPSFGNEGKHPSALGAKGKECWPEIWDIVSPLMLQVERTGEATWMENQLVPIYRNGKLEDVYWTYSYSSVLDDNGVHNGILVTCMETTDAIKSRMQLQDSETLFRNMIEQAPFAIALTRGEDIVIESINAPMLQIMNKGSLEEVSGKKMIEVLPEVKDQAVLAIVKNVLKTGEIFRGTEVSVDLLVEGTLHNHYFDVTYTPVAEAGKITSVLHVAIDVTEQVLARRKVEDNEALLRTVFDASPNSLSVFEPILNDEGEIEDLRFLMVNAFTVQTTGKADLVGKQYGSEFPHVKQTGVLEAFIEVAKTGAPADFEKWYEGEGLRHWFRFIVNKVGNLVVATVEDITKRKEAEKAIQESEQYASSLFYNSPVAMLVYAGPDMVLRQANEKMLEIFGRGDNIIGKPIMESIPELKTSPLLGYYRTVLETGRTHHQDAEQVLLMKAGQPYWGYYNYAYKPLYNSEGHTYGVLCTSLDVTEKIVAQRKIEESEQNLRNMILQAPVAMCIFRGKEFVIEIANEKMFEFWGRPSKAVIGKPLFEALPEAKNQGYEELMHNVLNTGVPFAANELPVTLPRPGGTQTVYINFAYEPLRELDGTLSGIMALAIDVTEQVMARHKIEEVVEQRTKELAIANETLSSLNQELRRSNKNLEDFAHAASHDLKEPVRKIQFFSNKLKGQLSSHLSQSEAQSFNRIENSTQRMGNLIDDLLLYSHVSHRPQETEAIDLNEKVQPVLEDLDLDIEEKRATINVGKLPVVQGYRRQLQQLFQNLISNALKYSKVDVPPVIHVTAEEVERAGRRYHVILVKDNGIGFAQEYAEKIFQMFSRLHGKAEYSGTGVGLSIVKKVVENHSGFIEVESIVGEGSVFKIYLPT